VKAAQIPSPATNASSVPHSPPKQTNATAKKVITCPFSTKNAKPAVKTAKNVTILRRAENAQSLSF
jgi:hypothetical protein